jgi:hypothetical protein
MKFNMGPKSHGGSATLLPGAEGATSQKVLLAPAAGQQRVEGRGASLVTNKISGREGEAALDVMQGAGSSRQQLCHACVCAAVVVAAAGKRTRAAAQPKVTEQVVVRTWTGAWAAAVVTEAAGRNAAKQNKAT